MTPQQKEVIDAARAYVAAPGVHEGTPGRGRLCKAVAALDAALAATEREYRYAEIVTTDEIWSEKAGKWFAVEQVSLQGRMVRFRLAGTPKVFEKPAAESVRVRRSAMGEALDVFNDVLWSGEVKA